jgi:hypothetical protein
MRLDLDRPAVAGRDEARVDGGLYDITEPDFFGTDRSP